MHKLVGKKDQIATVMAESPLTLKQFIDHYGLMILPEKMLRKASLVLSQIRHRQIANGLGAMPLNIISPTHISDLLAGFSPCTSNQIRAVLVDLFHHAVVSNVAAKTCRRDHAKQRKQHIKKGIKAIRDHAPQWLKNAIDLGLLMSERPCDLVNLRFDDIKDGHMHITQQKTGTQNDTSWLKVEITHEFQKVIDQCRDGVDSPFLIHPQPNRKRDCGSKEDATKITVHGLSREVKKHGMPRSATRPTPLKMPGMPEIRATSLMMYELAGKNVQTIAGNARSNDTRDHLKGYEFGMRANFSPDLDIRKLTEDSPTNGTQTHKLENV